MRWWMELPMKQTGTELAGTLVQSVVSHGAPLSVGKGLSMLLGRLLKLINGSSLCWI